MSCNCSVASSQNRGVQDIFVICADGLSGIKDAIAAAYPLAEYQRCIVHVVRNTLKYVADKDKKAFANDLKTIYHCYYYGRDMEPDYEEAFRCFAIGAFAGQLESMYKIGDMYLRGQFVDKDEQEAFIIYNRCLEMMDDDSRSYVAGPVHLRLGDMCLKGIGTVADPEAALFHYNLAEILLYRMVKNGNYMYKKSLRLSIEGQDKARAALADHIPADEWIDEPI